LQGLLKKQLLGAAYSNAPNNPALIEALATAAITASQTDPAFAALLLRLPDISELFQDHRPANPEALSSTRLTMKTQLATQLSAFITNTLNTPAPAPFKPDAKQAGIRALRAAAMDLAAHSDTLSQGLPAIFNAATSMTEQLAALSALIQSPSGGQDAISAFFTQWKDSPLVIDKWFSVQARTGRIDDIQALRKHPDFDLGNPNRVRALAGVFAMHNLAAFHKEDGSGYDFLVKMVQEVDPLNPSLAARLLTGFEQWRILRPNIQELAKSALARLGESSLSDNAKDILARTQG